MERNVDANHRGGGISDNLTDEQETEIAENIYDWWISSKPYKQWYAEKFQQQDLFDKLNNN